MPKFGDILLFACSGLHLSGGTIVAASSLWSLYRLSYYFWTTELGAELCFAAIVLAGSLLCLPICWLTTIVPYHKKSLTLPATLICLAAAAVPLFVSSLQSTAHLSCTLRDQTAFNASMQRALRREGIDVNAKYAFASMQLMLQCCGIESYKDWYAHRHTLPPSCCGMIANDKGGPLCNTPTYAHGCMRPAIAELHAFNNSTALLCGIMILALAVTIMAAGYQLAWTILEKEKSTQKPISVTYSTPFAPVASPPSVFASQPLRVV